MTPHDLSRWRSTLGWSAKRAAEELGVHYNTYRNWERGVRNGQTVEIPHTTALACSAIFHRLPPYGQNAI